MYRVHSLQIAIILYIIINNLIFVNFIFSEFRLNCSVDTGRPLTITCDGIYGDIEQVFCVYDEIVGPGAMREEC